ncbi:MAG: 30S ribosomal protein S20 [Candidatus Paceibacterota bacterium]|jgi:small subunit ribosomal protein S20
MPITSSAKKALRSSKRKRVFNVRRRDEIGAVTKDIKKLVTAGKKADALKLLSQAYKQLDKAAKTGYIKKNAASRKKSRLATLVKKAK